MEKQTRKFSKQQNTERKHQIYFLLVISTEKSSTAKNYYSQVFLDEFKYAIKEKKIHNYITDDVEMSSDSAEENYNEDNSDKEVLGKKQIKKNSYEEE